MYSDMYPGDGGYKGSKTDLFESNLEFIHPYSIFYYDGFLQPESGWTDDYTDMPGYGGRRCCPLKAVESPSDESMNEMYALVERVPWSQVKENCSSNCAYVKMKDLMMVMDEMKNMTDNMTNMEGEGGWSTPPMMNNSRMESNKEQDMMTMLLGEENVKMMKMKMMINRLPKYCFQPSDNDVQSMCAAPNMDMDVMGMVLGE